MRAASQFSPGGRFGANDSVNFPSETYRTTSALASYAGHDSAVVLAVSAIRSFDNFRRVLARRA
jgi:hypothetical protein